MHRKFWKTLRDYVVPYRRTLYLGLFCLIVTNFCQVMIPVFVKQVVDTLSHRPGGSIGLLVGAIVLFALLQALFRTLSRLAIFNTGRRVEFTIRNQLFDHLQKLPMSYYASTSTGQLMANLTNDLTYMRLLFGFGILHLINTVISFGFIVPAVISLQWRLALMTLAIYPLVFLGSRPISRRIFTFAKQEQQLFGEMSNILNESFAGIRLIKTYNAAPYRQERFNQAAQEYLRTSVGHASTRILFTQIMQASGGAGIVLVIAYGGLMVVRGTMTLGDFVAFSAYLYILAWPTLMTGWLIPLLQRGVASFERVQKVLGEPIETGYLNATPEDLRITGSVTLNNLHFAYPDTGRPGVAAEVLQGIDLEIKAGQRVLITGPVGAGKTTLLKLVGGLYPVARQQLFFDGRDAASIDLTLLRRSVSYCPQDGFVFSRTLADNILFASNNRLDLESAATMAALQNDKGSFEQEWETVIGEQGVTLSGGQRQRTALARALAKQASIILLDDPLAQLDASTAAQVWGQIDERFAGTTLLLVSQRFPRPESFDRIVVLKEGRLYEQGDHQSLMERNDLYAHLFNLQNLLWSDA